MWSPTIDAFQYEFRGQPFNGLTLQGIGLADLYGGFAVSLDANAEWAMPMVPVNSMQLDDNGDISIVQKEVIHATGVGHINSHAAALKRILQNEVSTPAELWANRDDYLPNLGFLDQVERDLQSIEDHAFRQITAWLFTLNAGLENWDPAVTATPDLPPHTTNESESRRPFFELNYGGKKLSFGMHGRYTPGAGRIHFAIVRQERRCIIGYIGQKVISKLTR
jgi:hypothetical protein